MRSLSSLATVAALRAFGVRRLDAHPDLFLWSLAKRQAIWKEPAPPDRLFRSLGVERIDERGCLCYRISPRRDTGSADVFYLHGGGYSREITGTHWSLVAKLAERFGCTVTVPIYPLVPAADATEVLSLLLQAYTGLRVTGRRRVVMGDSAGGGMAMGLAQLLRADHLPGPDRLVLLCPHLDCTMSNPGGLALERYDPIVSVFGIAEACKMYAGALDLDDPLVSPINADLTGLSPITLFTGTREVLYPDCRLFRDRARRAGVELDYHEYPGMFHGWMLLPIREARPVLDHLGSLLRPPG
ncbi:alpha/beta hydrolase [Nonomuraea diastatica]|uniref:Alpha/beta hydrolase n=1 Tax=Nonomuraea diastatica TaxID=1848329 RepID=A0A4R4WBH2_9ACTN|nr:alpha/beta hydrolase [Nonomuraea diastatica]TDD15491.1 alpha/beta hydrolase [Nonomuraea diastatica]